MTDTTVGPLFSRTTLERKTVAHIQNWLPYYIARVEIAHAIEPQTIALPKSWRVTDEFSRRPEDSLPFIDVISTGTAPGKRAQRDGDGQVRAWWIVAVGAVVTARSELEAKDLAGYYATAIRALMTQIPDLGGFADGCEWEADSYDDWPAADERSLAAARSVFTVEVHNIAHIFEAPPFSEPPEDPYTPDSDEVLVTSATFEIDKEDQ